jgi:glycosyltransferase involved in cell wall biosynthesis
MPNVLLEAMVCGTPVISSDCESGPAEILEGGRWGALCRVNDAGALQMAIREVRQQAEAAKFRAIEAKTAIESHWTIQAATDRLQEILEAAAKQKPGFSENPSW